MVAVYVGKFAEGVKEQDLNELFSKLGRITRIDFRKDYAFLHYEDRAGAEAAVAEYNGKDLFGKILRVNINDDRSRRDGFSKLTAQSGDSWGRPRQDREGAPRRDAGEGSGYDRSGGAIRSRPSYRADTGDYSTRPPPRDYARADGARPRSTACFNCGQEGHWSKECPEPRAPRPGSLRSLGEGAPREAPAPRAAYARATYDAPADRHGSGRYAYDRAPHDNADRYHPYSSSNSSGGGGSSSSSRAPPAYADGYGGSGAPPYGSTRGARSDVREGRDASPSYRARYNGRAAYPPPPAMDAQYSDYGHHRGGAAPLDRAPAVSGPHYEQMPVGRTTSRRTPPPVSGAEGGYYRSYDDGRAYEGAPYSSRSYDAVYDGRAYDGAHYSRSYEAGHDDGRAYEGPPYSSRAYDAGPTGRTSDAARYSRSYDTGAGGYSRSYEGAPPGARSSYDARSRPMR